MPASCRVHTSRLKAQQALLAVLRNLSGAYRSIINFGGVMSRVLPGLREQSIVPVDVIRIKAQLAFLYVLLDGGLPLVLQPKAQIFFSI